MSIEYRSIPYDGDAVILMPEGKVLELQHCRAWERYIRGNIQYDTLAGAAHELLRRPYVRDVAGHLLKRIQHPQNLDS